MERPLVVAAVDLMTPPLLLLDVCLCAVSRSLERDDGGYG